MEDWNSPRWTIDELQTQAALALSVGYEEARDERVRAIPDQRTIRYYTTLGLIDRPAEMRGRTALYGLRHLTQLVAIKRLQAKGLRLTEIQRRLVGITNQELARLANLGELERVRGGRAEVRHPCLPEHGHAYPAARSGGAFWRESSTPVAASAPAGEEQSEEAVRTLQGIRLSNDATLLLAVTRPVEEEDVAAIRTAAAPLVKLLERRRLIRRRE